MTKRVKPEEIYMDTTALIALANKNDKNHERARNFLKSKLREGVLFIVGRPVFMEFLNGVSKRVSKKKAIELYEAYTKSKFVVIEKETEEDWEKAWSIFLKYDNQDGMDLVDCLSFAIMERLGLKKAFTFDKDFETYGFIKLP